jgi:uncharacterized sporulation protein YeaH/YhbH (DUF444 family)
VLTVRRSQQILWLTAEADRERHRGRLVEAIRQNLPHLISQEEVVFAKGGRVIKVPLRGLEEFRLCLFVTAASM